MLIEITSDGELERLLGIGQGFLLKVDHHKNLLILHMIYCRYCNPTGEEGVKPSRKIDEFWFSNLRNQIISKIKQFSTKGYTVSLCKVCNPMEIENK